MTTATPPARPERVRLQVEGMHCASCVGRVESALAQAEGVERANVSLAEGSAIVEGHGLDPDRLAEVVRERGYDARPVAERESVETQRTELETRQHRRAAAWRNRAIVGFSAWLPVEIAHWTVMRGHEGHSITWDWIVAVLAVFIQVYVGGAFYRSAFRAARAGTTNMDTLVSLGATAAFGFSVVVFTLRVLGYDIDLPLYFGEAMGLLTLISLGHWLEARTTAAAGSAVRELLALQPDEVTRLASPDDSTGLTVHSSEVRVGDLLLIRPGERVAVDGEILRGRSAFDEAVVTGEPIPVERGAGEPVVAGSMNLTGTVVIATTRDGRDTTVARIAEMVRTAQASKANIQQLADRVSGIFVPVVIAIAALTFVGWVLFGGENSWLPALINATSVLIISCPCALGLATPTAVMVGSGVASRRGILVKSAQALERAARIDVVMLDKTGTITVGRPRVVEADDDTLAIAAAVARGSRHPLSRAIVEEARRRRLNIPDAEAIHEQAGRGVRGTVGGRSVELMSIPAARDAGWWSDRFGPDSSLTQTAVAVDGSLRGVIGFRDEVRPEAPRLFETLRAMNVEAMVLTGDRADAARDVAQRAGLEPDRVRAELKPEDKVAAVREQAAAGRVVAMIGDGINDAAALAEAGATGGVGIAIGAGANIAIESADVVIPGERLPAAVETIRISRETLKTIKQNLFFSFVYNVIAIPAAALGFFGVHGPLIAAGGMAFSDVTVVGNSLRLRRRLRRRLGHAPANRDDAWHSPAAVR